MAGAGVAGGAVCCAFIVATRIARRDTERGKPLMTPKKLVYSAGAMMKTPSRAADSSHGVEPGRERLANLRHQAGAFVDETGVELDQRGAGVELLQGVVRGHDAADGDDG